MEIRSGLQRWFDGGSPHLTRMELETVVQLPEHIKARFSLRVINALC